jgi:hypothetical protein
MFVKLCKWQEISCECKSITLIGLVLLATEPLPRTPAKTKMH